MPYRTVLSAAQRDQFEALPTKPVDLARHYILATEDLDLVRRRRQPKNRLGFAVQLCLMRFPGRRLRPGERLPEELVAFVAEQVEAPASALQAYAVREETRREHFLLLMRKLEMKAFGLDDYRLLIQWSGPKAIENPKGVFLVCAVLHEMRRRRILQPPLSVVERLVAAAQSRADRQVFRRIHDLLSSEHRRSIDSWLTSEGGRFQSRMSWVRRPVGNPSPAGAVGVFKRLDAIETLELPPELAECLPETRRAMLAREGRRVTVANLRTFQESRRYAVAAITLLDIRRSLIDDVITMHDRIIGGVLRRSKQKQAEYRQNRTKQTDHVVATLALVGRSLIRAKESGEPLEPVIPWHRLQSATEDAETLSEPRNLSHLQFADTPYFQLRRYTPKLLSRLDFQSASGGADVLAAVDVLREMNETKRRKLPEGAPLSFVPEAWRPFVERDTGLDRHYYELCALNELRDRLRSGDIWVPGSRQYKDFEGYLLSRSAFAELCRSESVPVAVEIDGAAYLAERTELLRSRLDEVHHLLESGRLEDVTVKGNGFSIARHRGLPVAEDVTRFAREVYGHLPRIKITDLLVEVDEWTGFTEQLTHLRTGLPSDDKEGLLAVVLSDGINLGLTRMADACPGKSFRQLSWIADWYITEEGYSKALAELVNRHHRTDLVASWGDGTTSSSDGQWFSLGGNAKPLGDVNPRYGRGPGVTFYTHVSDQYTPFHTQLIRTNTRDATFVIDGLLYHGSELKIDEHYTDSAGYTDHVFGLCHLLGFRFAPRIRDLGSLSLFPIDRPDRWPCFQQSFGDRIRVHEIEKHWNDILRLVASIRSGTVTASLIIRKLTSYPRQNRIALALREVGRIERTLYMLNWMQDPQIRGRAQAGLNKGESRNALARTVFFNRLGELRDRSFEDQFYRASGLNLVVAAIILWNTVYLEKAIAEVGKHREIPEDYLAYLSPLGWSHINLTGDYVWRLNP